MDKINSNTAEVFLDKLYYSLNGRIGNTEVAGATVAALAGELDAYSDILGGKGLGIIRLDANGPGTLELQGTISSAVDNLEVWGVMSIEVTLDRRGVFLVQIRRDPNLSYLVSVLPRPGDDGYY